MANLTAAGVRKSVAGLCLILTLAGVGVACSKGGGSAKEAEKRLKAGLQAQVDGKLDVAAENYRAVLKVEKDNKFAIYNLGLIDQRNGALTDAELKYRRVLQIDPNYEPALFNLGIIRNLRGDKQEAIRLYRQAIAANDKDAPAHLNLGLLLKEAGDMTVGDAEIQRAGQLDPKLVSASTTTTAHPVTTTTKKP